MKRKRMIAGIAIGAITAIGGFVTPAIAADDSTVERVLFSSIAPVETTDTYNQWHQGQWDRQNLDGVSVSADGLLLEGKNQIIKGAAEQLQGTSVTTLASTFDIDADIESGSLWYQIPLYYGPQISDTEARQADFTTLRKDVTAQGDMWTTSRAIRTSADQVLLAAQKTASLEQIEGYLAQAAATYNVPVTIAAFGFLSSGDDAAATVRTFSAAGVTYDFRKVEVPGADVSVAGTASVGNTLTATAVAVPNTEVSYQWFRNGEAIADAVSNTLSLTPDLVGVEITVSANYTSQDYFPVVVTSDPVTVTAGKLANPVVAVAGKAEIGANLKANATWASAPQSVTYQWYAGGQAISGATKASYTVTVAEAGKKLSVKVTGTTPGYTTATATSAPTAKVAKLAPKVTAKVLKKPAKGKVRQIKVTVKVAKAPVVAGQITVKSGKKSVTKTIKKNAKNVVKVKIKAAKKATVTFTPNKVTSAYTAKAKTIIKKLR